MKPYSNLPNRRQILKGLGASAFLLSTTSLTQPALAQDESEFAFDYDSFSARMQELAKAPFAPVTAALPEAFQQLDYDAYRKIQYRAEAGKWADDNAGYRLQAFHLGWLYAEPVKVFEVEAG
ncbi:Glucans biosynthesis protein G precursor [compost metagenome]